MGINKTTEDVRPLKDNKWMEKWGYLRMKNYPYHDRTNLFECSLSPTKLTDKVKVTRFKCTTRLVEHIKNKLVDKTSNFCWWFRFGKLTVQQFLALIGLGSCLWSHDKVTAINTSWYRIVFISFFFSGTRNLSLLTSFFRWKTLIVTVCYHQGCYHQGCGMENGLTSPWRGLNVKNWLTAPSCGRN